MSVYFQVILFGLLFGGSRSVDLTAAQYQVMLSVLGLCLAYNLYCALVIAHWRRNICEELQLANTPFWSLVSPTDHQRRGGKTIKISNDSQGQHNSIELFQVGSVLTTYVLNRPEV